MAGDWFFCGDFFPMNFLATIIALRFIIDPVMTFALKSKLRFWGLNAGLLVVSTFTSIFLEYGSLALIMAMAGWISRNRDETPAHIVKPADYFCFTGGAFIIFTAHDLSFPTRCRRRSS